MSRSSSSTLLAAESMLDLIERSRTRIRALKKAPEIIQELIPGVSTDHMLIAAPPEADTPPPIQLPIQATPYEEQQTQAVSEGMLHQLDNASLKPPVRSPVPPVRHESHPSPDEAEVAETAKPEAEGEKEGPLAPDEPPIKARPAVPVEPSKEEAPAAGTEAIQATDQSDAESRSEARSRTAVQIREAQQAASESVKKERRTRRKAEDQSFQQARVRGVAAIQLTSTGGVRTVREAVAIGEAEQDDLEQEALRSTQAEGGLQVDVLIPEVEIGETDDLPELTDSAAPFSSLTGLQVKDGPEPGMIAEFLGKARSAENRGDLQNAIVAYGDALDVNADLEIAWIGRGRCRTEIGDYGAALSDLKRAQGIAPRSIQAVLEMGHLFYARKDYLRSIHYYSEVLAMAPETAMALGRRGLCHHYLENSDQALRDLSEAMNIDPTVPNLKQSLQMVELAATSVK